MNNIETRLENIAATMAKVEWTPKVSNEFNTILDCFGMISGNLTDKESKMAALDHMEAELGNIANTEAYKQSVATKLFDLM